jgi:DNA invertase Pin-like site-specific DNA recombinase
MATLKNEGRVFSYVRWSSDGQEFGDSERRQIQAAEAWCARHGTKLSDERFVDAGVSAWKGANRTANLGRLLKTVKAGDVLLVEDNDRLSRQDWFTAMGFLRDIVSRGVKVVTLANGNEITEESFKRNPGVFLPAILKAYLGNDENEKRSYRIKQAMDARLQKLKEGKATFGRLPAWLAWDAPPTNPNRKVVVLEAKAELVRKVFALCLQGKGVLRIERAMQGSQIVANSSRAKSWNTRFIHRLLRDRSVLGWHTAAETAGVFPAILSEETFYAAQAKLDARRKLKLTVHTGQDNNLVTGLCRCGGCGHSLIRHTSRVNGHTYTYLFCSGKMHRLTDCKCQNLRYDLFERSFLSLLGNGDLVREALSGEVAVSSLDALRGELAVVQKQAEKILHLIEGEDDPPRRLLENLKTIEVKEAELERRIEAESVKTSASISPLVAYDKFRAEFAGRMEQPEFRSLLRELLRDVVEKIVMDKSGRHYAVHFRAAPGIVDVVVDPKNNGWLFRSLKPGAAPDHI